MGCKGCRNARSCKRGNFGIHLYREQSRRGTSRRKMTATRRMTIDKLLLAVCTTLLFAATLPAHHSFTAEYDSTKLRQFTGTVTKIEWTNPHARFYLDVKDEKGVVTNWN